MADNRFRFTNEKCPVCNNTFNSDDDIVVCPECGTPHHRECYTENKSCANHYKHSEDFRWEPDFVPVEEAEEPKSDLTEKSIYRQAMEMAEMPFPAIQVEKINPFSVKNSATLRKVFLPKMLQSSFVRNHTDMYQNSKRLQKAN